MTAGELSNTFAYQAQTPDGLRMSGTVDAQDVADASRRLVELGLRISEITPTARPPRPRALGAADFAAFNQQLAHLAKAGLPLEHGMRLIAADLGSGRLSRTIQLVTEELEQGTSLEDAFNKHRQQFPRLYGRLVAAGVRAGNLPGVLFNLGRHLELVQRLREALWRAFAYPLMVLLALLGVMIFLGIFVLPKFEVIFREFKMELPAVTQVLLQFSAIAPVLLVVFVVIIIGVPLIAGILRARGSGGSTVDFFARWVPLVGPVIRRNLVARWCDGLCLGIAAGLDLPTAIEIAGDVTGSPALRHDGAVLIQQLQAGQPLDGAGPLRLIPATIPATLHFAAGHQDLPGTIETLGQMYERQAELRLGAIPAILTPLLVLFVAAVIALVVFALVAPLLSLIRGMTSIH